MRIAIPCLFVMPVLWYPTYAPIREMCHVLDTCLVGGSVTLLYPVPFDVRAAEWYNVVAITAYEITG